MSTSEHNFRITPLAPLSELRRMALASAPPVDPHATRQPDLVEVGAFEPGIRYDIRYASTNNFMGGIFYASQHAFLQRPAAEALVRVHQSLESLGLGLWLFDAYRPWFVTKMFWEGTPEEYRRFVATPSLGSRHNRGSAVDVTLYDLSSGLPIAMPSGYDEFSPRAYVDYAGGPAQARANRDTLRAAMEAQGFDVYTFEWWHFDHADWSKYPILNLTFEEITISS